MYRWEYTFCLHTCRLGDRIREATNPFTGERIRIHIDDGLTSAELAAVRKHFDAYGVQGPEPEGEGYALYLPSNGSVRFRGGPDLDDTVSCALTGYAVEIVVSELSDDVLGFVHDVARHGNMAFMSSIGDEVCLVNEPISPKLKQRWPNAHMILTIRELRAWLENRIEGRMVYVPSDD